MKYIYLLLPVFYFWTNPVFAAWYQVEVIIFENIYSDGDGELWYENPGIPRLDGSTELVQSGHGADKQDTGTQGTDKKPLIPFLILPKDKYRMDGIYRVMKSSKEYRPLVHVSWQQPGGSGERAVHIEKHDGTLPESGISDDNEPDFLIPPRFIVDGTIRIRSSHFLHVDVDLVYFIDTLSNTGSAPSRDSSDSAMSVRKKAEYVRMNETRKIKLNELHYFDHPMFGVILQVTRL
ncbi:MAG: hypothetical protein A2W28_00320 [Gammaproteobacteria bacterium RBG_16_51_14]|nr:MAG: hypothetical protein A2W28_00320 [Gammaproteobacteria bacterium RBG_16_51_14]